MSKLLIALLSTLAATNEPVSLNLLIAQTTGLPLSVSNANDPVEIEYEKLLELDDAAQAEADRWIQEGRALQAQSGGISMATLSARIEQRFVPVQKAYEDFIRSHPNHVRARLAYGSFLYDTHKEEAAVAQWQKAVEVDPKNPAAWNNLANHFGHVGPVKKAFEYYAKAIELAPREPVYLQNLATTTYLFRKDAREYYDISEQEVFDRSLELYRRALELDPTNFPLATDYAQSYYGIRPLRADEAITAWNLAMKVANDDIEREGVHLHLARVNILAERFGKAQFHLRAVRHSMYDVLKSRLQRNLDEKSKPKSSETSQPHAPDSSSAP